MAGWFGGRISQPVLTPLSSVDLVSEFGMICSLKRGFLTIIARIFVILLFCTWMWKRVTNNKF